MQAVLHGLPLESHGELCHGACCRLVFIVVFAVLQPVALCCWHLSLLLAAVPASSVHLSPKMKLHRTLFACKQNKFAYSNTAIVLLF